MLISKNEVSDINFDITKRIFEKQLIETDLNNISHSLLYDFNRLIEEIVYQKLNSLGISFKNKSINFDYFINICFKPSKLKSNKISTNEILNRYNNWIMDNSMFPNHRLISTEELNNLMSYLGYNEYSTKNHDAYYFDLR
jgi:hypothetical protein